MAITQEALLPDTDAIPRGTVTIGRYRGKTLVRYRNAAGYTRRRTFADLEEANAQFQEWVNALRAALKAAK